jgi:hypothetical protein
MALFAASADTIPVSPGWITDTPRLSLAQECEPMLTLKPPFLVSSMRFPVRRSAGQPVPEARRTLGGGQTLRFRRAAQEESGTGGRRSEDKVLSPRLKRRRTLAAES